MYKKILAPVDGSESCNNSLGEAIKIAKAGDAKITAIHVYPDYSKTLVDPKEAIPEILRHEAESILTNAKRIAIAEGFKIETLMVSGDPVKQIIKTANDENFDLIVMGARGKNIIEKLVLGSVSSGVLKGASCPVLITKCNV